jgi:hypothetical protein
MAQAANKLYSRGEIRVELTNLRNDWAVMLVKHRDSFRGDASHVETTCKFCASWKSMIDGIDRAVRHFGGRR